MPNIKHILVIRLSAMGDVAMTVPVLRAFQEQYPDIKLTVLTREFFKPFFRDLKNVSVFSADVKRKHKGVLGLYKLSKELKKLNTDAVADLHNVLRSNILKFFLLGIKVVQIDKGRKAKQALISGKEVKQLKTTVERYADVFRRLGFLLDLSNPKFPEKKALSNKAIEIIGSDTKEWIGIAPFAAYESKMYPLDLLTEVINSLSKKYRILLFGGGKHEIEQLNKLQDEFENVTSIAGKLSLKEEIDVISNLDVMLSADSGNGHIAAMLGIKVVTIWGVTHPFAGFTPFNQPTDYCLLPDRDKFPKIPTSIYGNKYPENYKEAIRSISPETIVNKINSILS
ncbi:glycosyltransferase family 9 protein [Yeosuana sp. MJ-SS3]|jgi:ADP-heptose:LPS heptosyltransferase|uniref:Glycosyltransferase family 9 protein n=1 Tax=Gilvirhabdus luticola TaxID=3079858 RepID=A0ABU3U2J7_9FLAO|nr:glycosyltransferase family 9 protein [Yeosuana sp. MJ-SS3]MDU8884629.1 glycosyltransferase family 9 protein [Yeosuana sp. MJ-SS3]